MTYNNEPTSLLHFVVYYTFITHLKIFIVYAATLNNGLKSCQYRHETLGLFMLIENVFNFGKTINQK